MRRFVCMNFSPFVPPVEMSSKSRGSASDLMWTAIPEGSPRPALLQLGSHTCRVFGEVMLVAQFLQSGSERFARFGRHGADGPAAGAGGISDHAHGFLDH